MKYLTLLLALTIPRCMLAAPPSCYAGDGIAAETVPTVNIQSGGACVIWHCPSADGHQWKKVFICGTWSEATDAAIATLRTAMNSDKATKDALWTATFNQPIAPGSVDEALITSAKTIPVPTKLPPSGLVTTDTRAYRINRISNATPTFTVFGSVTLGIPCDPANLNGFHRIDIALVKVPAKVLKPLEAFGKCDP